MRIVMFVRNGVTHDARVLREAATLATAGHAVTVVGRLAGDDSQAAEEIRGAVRILRVAGSPGPMRRWRAFRSYPWRLVGELVGEATAALRAGPPAPGAALRAAAGALALLPWAVLRGAVRVVRGPGQARSAAARSAPATQAPLQAPTPDDLDWVMTWWLAVGSWAEAAAAAAPHADAWHGHDLSGIMPAIRARSHWGGRLIFDAHEVLLESRTSMRRASWARAIIRRMERAAYRRSDALVTVNAAVAEELARRYGRPVRTVIAHNAPPLPARPRSRPGPLRTAIGLDEATPVLLYHGGFSAERGIEQLIAAARDPRLGGAHVAFLGYGDLHDWLLRRATDPDLAGRVHVLSAVAPDVMLDWIADADLGVMAIQPTTLNHRLATPNKLFECLAAGVPVVAGDLPGMRQIVMGDPAGPLGALCDPTDPEAIAEAVAWLLAMDSGDRRALRARCLQAARDRWNWETEGAKLTALYASLENGVGVGSSSKDRVGREPTGPAAPPAGPTSRS